MFSILSFITNGQYMQAVIAVLSTCFVVFCCLPVHELAHAYTAHRLGDNTAKQQGRLTFNPLAHLDVMGTIMIFLIGIGYAKPVPVNISRFKNPKKGMALVALAGPVSNILMAFVSIFLAYFVRFCALRAGSVSSLVSGIILFFNFAATVNISLAVFNLLPIPPLDGSRILNAALPYKQYYKLMKYERYIMIGLFILLFTGVLSRPLSFLTQSLYNALALIPKLIFG